MLKVKFEKHQFRFIQCRVLGAVQGFIPAVSSHELFTSFFPYSCDVLINT